MGSGDPVGLFRPAASITGVLAAIGGVCRLGAEHQVLCGGVAGLYFGRVVVTGALVGLAYRWALPGVAGDVVGVGA